MQTTRIIDITLATTAILGLLPLLIVVAVVLRLSGEGDIFYFQQRVGRHGKTFPLVKFATMLRDSPSLPGGTITTKDDPRILPMGRLLRKTKINELPQLYNILCGHMSLIGPRPQTRQCFEGFPAHLQHVVQSTTPGLSGIGSIIFRNEEDILHQGGMAPLFYRNTISPYKAEVEAWYVENSSLSTYFKLLFLTAWVVLFPKSRLVWYLFPSVPKPSPGLAKILGFPEDAFMHEHH